MYMCVGLGRSTTQEQLSVTGLKIPISVYVCTWVHTEMRICKIRKKHYRMPFVSSILSCLFKLVPCDADTIYSVILRYFYPCSNPQRLFQRSYVYTIISFHFPVFCTDVP